MGQSFESRGETGSSACAHEIQRVSLTPKVVFVRPIVGRLEDLTNACLTSFQHSADTIALNNETGLLLAAPQVDPPLATLAIEYRPMGQELVPPPPHGVGSGGPRHILRK